MNKVKNITIYIIISLLSIYFTYIAINYYKQSLIDNTKYLTYETLDKSYYELYYMSNNLIKGRSTTNSFIKKYIDKIKINYDYSINFSDLVDINNSYLIKATLIVYSPNTEDEIWRSNSEYLQSEKEKKITKNKTLANKESVTIDYQKYLELSETFKKETGIYSDSKILVEFMNTSNINYDNLKPINKNDTITYNIPLTDATIKITKDNNIKESKTTKYDNNKVMKREFKYLKLAILYLILGITCLGILIYRFWKYINQKDEYSNKLRKILKDYDSIIINITKMPKLNDNKIVEVTNFKELVDVELELHKPINYIEVKENKEAWFLIITNDITWIYKLIKRKGDNKNAKKKK